MPLNPRDPYYVAELTPQAITDLGPPLRAAFGVGPDAFGSKGNTVHLSGYHRSRQWILNSPDSNRGEADYSVQLPLDRGGDQRWVSAADFTPGAWGTADNRAKMRLLTGRLHAAALARDPRLSTVREVAGTLDGAHVVTFSGADGSPRSPFDSSHLDHLHISFYRSRAGDDHSGVLQVLLGQPAKPQTQTGEIMSFLASCAGAVVVSDGKTCSWVKTQAVVDELTAILGPPRHITHVESLGLLIGDVPEVTPKWPGAVMPTPAVVVSDAQWAQLVTAVTAEVAAHGAPLTAAQVGDVVRTQLNATRLTGS